jgi:hypothetical protein
MCVRFLVIGKDFSDRSPHITRTTIAAIMGHDKEEHFIGDLNRLLKKKSIFYLLWKTIWNQKRILFAPRKQTNLHSEEISLSCNAEAKQETNLHSKDFSLQRSKKLFTFRISSLSCNAEAKQETIYIPN